MSFIRCIVILCLVTAAGFGQSGKAELFGTVRDPAQLGVAGAQVTAVFQQTAARFEGVSEADGSFHLLGLPAGVYSLQAEKQGFKNFEARGIVLRINDQAQQDVELELGPAAQAVTINEQTSALETATGAVRFGVGSREVAALPLDGRNFIPLVALSPGVALPGGGSLLPRINGSRPRTNEYIYDGISALQPEPGQVVFYPVIDAIEEFRLNINAYSPEYGRSNGGTVIVARNRAATSFTDRYLNFSVTSI